MVLAGNMVVECLLMYPLVIHSVMYSMPTPRTAALHNDQSLRDARAQLHPAVITSEVITVLQPHTLLLLSQSYYYDEMYARVHARTHAHTCLRTAGCTVLPRKDGG